MIGVVVNGEYIFTMDVIRQGVKFTKGIKGKINMECKLIVDADNYTAKVDLWLVRKWIKKGWLCYIQ